MRIQSRRPSQKKATHNDVVILGTPQDCLKNNMDLSTTNGNGQITTLAIPVTLRLLFLYGFESMMCDRKAPAQTDCKYRIGEGDFTSTDGK